MSENFNCLTISVREGWKILFQTLSTVAPVPTGESRLNYLSTSTAAFFFSPDFLWDK
jgi:hypothetical protein